MSTHTNIQINDLDTKNSSASTSGQTSSSHTPFRTRQAPSPTGYLHLGTTRQMLFSKLFAVSQKGSWYIRIEDTDRKRLVEDAVLAILEPLAEMGILPDEGASIGYHGQTPSGLKDEFYGIYQNGEYGPYIQSERLKLYHEHAQKMIDQKMAYWSFFSEKDKEELVKIKASTKKAIDYFAETQKTHSEEEMFMSIEKGLVDPRECALRFRLKRDQVISFKDELMGDMKADLSLEEDFIIIKNDGFASYHFAHLIDDRFMKTSLILRSQEWLPSMARHVTMFRDYWGYTPKYLHLPFVMGETGNKKLSKRDGSADMQDYLNQGFLPEAILNYLAFLGWNPGTEKEFYLEPEDFLVDYSRVSQ